MVMRSSIAFPVLIGDIGGTNARFQLIESASANPVSFDTVKTAAFETIEDAIQSAVLDQTSLLPKTAILAAAGPITADGLDLTNCHWNIKPKDFLMLEPFQHLLLMNDFEAQALSLPYLKDADIDHVSGANTLQSLADRTKAVIGPGTGLGVGLLVRAGEKWIPVAGEGGHVDLGPRSAREQHIWSHLETVEGRISAEQVVCGDGLVNLYNACCQADDVPIQEKTAAEISAAALERNNKQAEEALSLFCLCLGRVAGDLALTSMARGGVYIGGGIAQKILPFLKHSAFRDAFDDKAPHKNLMSAIATLVITHELPALVGLAAYACAPDNFAIDLDHRHWSVD